MGSRGTGRFGDYQGGGRREETLCQQEIKSINLEEVARLDYFKNNHGVPTVMEGVHVHEELLNGRIVVLLENTEENIGFLPTAYNYLLACIRKGYSYHGKVIYSVDKPYPRVEVELYAYEKE